MIQDWANLKYWETGEWQVVEERLDDLDRSHIKYNPIRSRLFASLDLYDCRNVRVAILGQDPYPNASYCTGLAFSIPSNHKTIPPTLSVIFNELQSDLHLPRPGNGSLEGWAKQGVLLWNVIPSCLEGHSLSHDWEEWKPLTTEIIQELDQKKVVFILLGSKARSFAPIIKASPVIATSHPSPRASRRATDPFIGSRIFSRANDLLCTLGKPPIDWRL